MMNTLRTALLFAATTLASAIALTAPSVAEEITLRLKGGGFEMSGTLEAYDGTTYRITSPVFGTTKVDGTRFDCVSSNCPKGPVSERISLASLSGLGANAEIQVAGSNTVGNALMPALIEAFAKRNDLRADRIVGADPLELTFELKTSAGAKVATIELKRFGSSTSFRALRAGEAEIGMSSRPIKDKEVVDLQAAGLGNLRAVGSEHIIGLDGLLILVAPSNPVVSLSIEQVSKIFSGEITDWSQLGRAQAGPIDLFAPGEDSGTYETFNNLVLKPNNVKLSPTTKRTEDHAQQSDWVARDPNAIGVVGIAYQRNSKPLKIETSCGLVTDPNVFSMKTEEYPLSRRLYLYTSGEPKSPLGRQLLNFSLSPEAQPVVSSVDFINQAPEQLSFAQQQTRVLYALNAQEENFNMALMRTMIEEMKPTARLSSTFRFQTGSFILDTKAQQDVGRLVNILQTDSSLDGRRIVLAGFADSLGDFASNLTLSRNRANAVRRAILAAEGGADFAERLEIKAYSELAPVACNDNAKGRQFNRRVEVWVR